MRAEADRLAVAKRAQSEVHASSAARLTHLASSSEYCSMVGTMGMRLVPFEFEKDFKMAHRAQWESKTEAAVERSSVRAVAKDLKEADDNSLAERRRK